MINGEVIWITGASTGIGRSLAIALASAGNRVIVSARGKDLLEDLAQSQENISALPFDVTDSAALATVSAELREQVDYLDRVIINAGNCEYFDVSNPDWDMMRRVMDVNFHGAINTVQLALPMLKKSPTARPHIIGIASLASLVPFPRAQAYGASKAALDYFLGSMAVDLADSDIDVTIIKPGFVKTPLTDKNDFPMPFVMELDVAVGRILKAMKRRPLHYSFPRRLSCLLKLGQYLPGFWFRSISPMLAKQQG